MCAQVVRVGHILCHHLRPHHLRPQVTQVTLILRRRPTVNNLVYLARQLSSKPKNNNPAVGSGDEGGDKSRKDSGKSTTAKASQGQPNVQVKVVAKVKSKLSADARSSATERSFVTPIRA